MTSEDSKIAELEQIIGYSFANKLLAAEALQMAGKVRLFTVDGASRGVKKNIDLALVGNSILATILCKMWYQARDSQGNRLTPGHWNDIRQQKLSNDSLGGLGFEIGIHRCIMKEAGLGRVSKKMVAQTVEAVIGAVYMDVDDNGMESVRAVIQDMGFAEHPHLMVMLQQPSLLNTESANDN
ncbi:ribonuclease III domain-containing protein [Dendryphion nanum]|uniref:Ribonuclease III domain-containing protein n=1 Tax=Dendryphion nanum TaxID=256645 RepID=A0A9P9E5E1_9PLEO|nr:ribonuclease III domain-containing protein [Dendryphion nanum]